MTRGEGDGGVWCPGVWYPGVVVLLIGRDGNAFTIIGRVSRALRRAGVPPSEIDRFRGEATAGDYDHVLQTCMHWVTVA